MECSLSYDRADSLPGQRLKLDISIRHRGKQSGTTRFTSRRSLSITAQDVLADPSMMAKPKTSKHKGRVKSVSFSEASDIAHDAHGLSSLQQPTDTNKDTGNHFMVIHCQFSGSVHVESQLISSSMRMHLPSLTHANHASSLAYSRRLSNYASQADKSDTMSEIPVLVTRSSILEVETSFGSGEHRAYVRSVDLPDFLLPTYDGIALRVSYILSVTFQGSDLTTRSAIFPIVIGSHPQKTSVLLSEPAALPLLEGTACRKLPQDQTARKRAEYLAYANRLSQRSVVDTIHSTTEDSADGGHLTSQTKFDIVQNTQRLCVLTLSKAAYTIGEVIHGRVDLSASSSSLQFAVVDIVLEEVESIPESALGSYNQDSVIHTRKLWTEEISCAEKETCSFEIPVPPDTAVDWSSDVIEVRHELSLRFTAVTTPMWLCESRSKHGILRTPVTLTEGEQVSCSVKVRIMNSPPVGRCALMLQPT